MNRTALVIGAAGGVGIETVKQLLAEGYRVVGTVFNDTEGDFLKSHAPQVASYFRLDLGNAESVVAAIREANLGPLDAVISCAAIAPLGPLETASLPELRKTLEINAVSSLAIYQAVLPLLRPTKGRLILISSMAGKVAMPFLGTYSSSKFALEALGDVMRREAKAWGVDVVLVEPGGVRTPMVTAQLAWIEKTRAALSTDEATLYGGLYDAFGKAAQQGYVTGIEPTQVARIIVDALKAEQPLARYTAGEDSKFMCDISRKPDAEIDAVLTAFMAG